MYFIAWPKNQEKPENWATEACYSGKQEDGRWTCTVDPVDHGCTTGLYQVEIVVKDTFGNTSNPATLEESISWFSLNRLKTLRLPTELTEISTEAFANTACQAVLLPSGKVQIKANAFTGCPKLRYLIMRPDTDVTFADDAYDENNIIVIRLEADDPNLID